MVRKLRRAKRRRRDQFSDLSSPPCLFRDVSARDAVTFGPHHTVGGAARFPLINPSVLPTERYTTHDRYVTALQIVTVSHDPRGLECLGVLAQVTKKFTGNIGEFGGALVGMKGCGNASCDCMTLCLLPPRYQTQPDEVT